MVVHFEIEEATEIFKGFTILNNWQKLGVDKKLRLKLLRAAASLGRTWHSGKG